MSSVDLPNLVLVDHSLGSACYVAMAKIYGVGKHASQLSASGQFL